VVQVDTGIGPTLSLELGASPQIASLRELDLGAVPGASVLLQTCWRLDAASTVELACLQAPASHWVAGLEDAVLDGASAAVRAAGGLAWLEAGSPHPVGDHLEQVFRGAGGGSGADRQAAGRHWLGTSGDGSKIVLCTLACESVGADSQSCEQATSGAIGSAFGPLPPPGAAVRAVTWAVGHPGTLALLALGLLVLLVALVHRVRPRPRP